MADAKTWVEDPKLLCKVAERAERSHSSRSAENKAYLRAYWDRPVVGRDVNYNRPFRENAVYDVLKEQRTANLTAEVVDAAVSVVCRDMAARVSPMGAEFELEQGCKEATRLIEGVFDNSDFGDIATECARACMTADIGPAKGYVDRATKEIRFERLDPLTTFWIHDGTPTPRTIITLNAVPRDALIARYPQHKAKLSDMRNMRTWAPKYVVGVDLPGAFDKDEADTVKVAEAWCTAIGDTKGAHVIACDDLVLEREEWEHQIAPVFWMTWCPERTGPAGRSLARIVGKYDMANRRMMRMVYAGLQGAVPIFLEHEDSDSEGLSDVEYQKVKWSGTVEPRVVIPQAVSPDVIKQIERNIAAAYAEGGVNQNMATGNAPARYTSGAAQREFVDIANTRLLRAQKQWEKFWRQAAKVVVMLAQQAGRMHVRVKGQNRYESARFPRLDRDKMRIGFGLASGLGLTPAARKQDLADLKDLGVIDTPQVARSLDLPDTREIADRINAPRDLIMQQIAMCLDKGIFHMPSALMDLPAAIGLGSQELQRAYLQGNYPPAHTEQLRRWIKACEARMPKPAAPPLPAQPMGAPAPMLPAPGAPPPMGDAPPAPAAPPALAQPVAA